MSQTETYLCPAKACDLEFPTSELAKHINEEHPGEWRQDGWPFLSSGGTDDE